MAEGHHEIVIIRRGGHGDHDEHHGGVWKIAFADFMTAMMAFFLVLWLISANDKTRASVARYFNPVRLVDATTQPRGLHESKKDDSGITASPNTKDNKEADQGKAPPETKEAAPDAETPKGREKRLDTELRDNPYLALAEIVGDKGPGEDALKSAAAPNPAIGHGGSAFRDPFAPPPPSIKSSLKSVPEAHDDASQKLPITDTEAATKDTVPPLEAKPAQPKANSEIKDETHKQIEIEKQTEALKTKLMLALKGLGPDQTGPAIDVKKTSEGTLLSLTDTSDFTMFSNGSAVPSKNVVMMMARIAQILKEKPGSIVIRGFTDNKKFRSGRYDNWHLSLDRAQVAHYMLVRGGLAEDRMSHVEGYADRGTLPGVDPANPRNRRIEILLKDNQQ